MRNNPGSASSTGRGFPRRRRSPAASGRVAVPGVKIATPRLPPRHVYRPRLTEALTRAGTDKVVLLSAPAGYGKTLLLTEWATVTPGRTAWVTLDRDDDDDRRFWSAVLAAWESCVAEPLPPLALPGTPSRDPAFLDAVGARFSDVPGPVRLVLDDLHELTATEPLRGLAGLVRGRQPGLQLILGTRSDPMLPLARMRLTDELCELRARDLAFSVDEAQALLAGAGVRPPLDQVRLLVDQTAGWAAGLRLAALALRQSTDATIFLTDLVANDRATADYLVQEIFSHLPAGVVEVLGAVSVCDQVTAQLAASLSERPEAGDVLLGLEQTTSLVNSYGDGRCWFRVHPLLQAHLRADLQRRRPDLLITLNTRAAAWYEAAHDPVNALRHARAAGDPAVLTELLRRHGPAMATEGHHATVGAAVGLLGERGVLDDPYVVLVGALAQLEVGNVDAVGRLLDRFDAEGSAPDDESAALLELIKARLHWSGRDMSDENLESVLTHTNGATRGDAVHLVPHATAALALGQFADAVRVAKEAVHAARQEGNAYLTARATTSLSVAQGMAGDLRGMTESAALSARTAPTAQWAGTEGEALNAVTWSYGLLMGGRPDECLRRLESGASFARRSHQPDDPVPSLLLTVVRAFEAAARFDLGGGEAALEDLRRIRTVTPPDVALRRPEALVALFEHDAAARLGHVEHTRAVVGWAAQRLGETGDLLYLRAWAPASVSRYGAARAHLQALLDGSVEPITPWVLVDAWVLECHIALRTGGHARAREAMYCALEYAAQLGALRPLISAPAEVGALMAQQLPGVGRLADVAEEALALRRARAADLPEVPLTQRERAVLALLPSLMPLSEIAEEMSVSVNTVKTHVRAIYAKLAVDSRRGAVDAALRLGLLDTTSVR